MPKEPETLLAGEYFLAVQGLAMIRSCVTRPSSVRPRVDDIRTIIEHFDEFPHNLQIPTSEHDVEDGYARWAPNYDGPNPAIASEEPIMRELLAGVAAGSALDAACGTGRHAAYLAQLGHAVIGVDTTEAMLEIARAKVPEADFRNGRLEALPVDDGSIDVLTCALAVEHVADLGPVFREFARVMKPGGHAFVSDMHPIWRSNGGVAAFPTDDGGLGVPFVAGFTHQLSEYGRALLDAGFTLRGLYEPVVSEEAMALFPSFRVFPDATRQAFGGQPLVVIWRLER